MESFGIDEARKILGQKIIELSKSGTNVRDLSSMVSTLARMEKEFGKDTELQQKKNLRELRELSQDTEELYIDHSDERYKTVFDKYKKKEISHWE